MTITISAVQQTDPKNKKIPIGWEIEGKEVSDIWSINSIPKHILNELNKAPVTNKIKQGLFDIKISPTAETGFGELYFNDILDIKLYEDE